MNKSLTGTHVFLVGDAAQTIYSFRGAKSANVMSLPNCNDRFLTKSWRFGPAIARIANIALFAKQNSPQTSAYTTKDRKLWIPYRVEGAGCVDESCSAITESIVENWRTKGPVTLMAYKNATLMMKVIELLGLGYLKVSSDTESLEECPPDSDSSASISELLPKFHINGKGEDSGPNKWKAVLTQLTSL